jgi:hypothetical protein
MPGYLEVVLIFGKVDVAVPREFDQFGRLIEQPVQEGVGGAPESGSAPAAARPSAAAPGLASSGPRDRAVLDPALPGRNMASGSRWRQGHGWRTWSAVRS